MKKKPLLKTIYLIYSGSYLYLQFSPVQYVIGRSDFDILWFFFNILNLLLLLRACFIRMLILFLWMCKFRFKFFPHKVIGLDFS